MDPLAYAWRAAYDVPAMATEHSIEFRVRYDEADRMGVVHHSRYLVYFEMGRVELMRAVGLPHLAQETQGRALVVTDVDVRYLAPARYDDRVRLTTSVAEARGAKVVFQSRLARIDPAPEAPLAKATVTAAAVAPDGAARQLTAEELAALHS